MLLHQDILAITGGNRQFLFQASHQRLGAAKLASAGAFAWIASCGNSDRRCCARCCRPGDATAWASGDGSPENDFQLPRWGMAYQPPCHPAFAENENGGVLRHPVSRRNSGVPRPVDAEAFHWTTGLPRDFGQARRCQLTPLAVPLGEVNEHGKEEARTASANAASSTCGMLQVGVTGILSVVSENPGVWSPLT